MSEGTRWRAGWSRLQTLPSSARSAVIGLLLIASYLILMAVIALEQPRPLPSTATDRFLGDVHTLVTLVVVLGPVWLACAVPAIRPRVPWVASLGIGLVVYLIVGVLVLVVASFTGVTSGLPVRLAVPLAPLWPAVLSSRVGCYVSPFPCWAFPNGPRAVAPSLLANSRLAGRPDVRLPFANPPHPVPGAREMMDLPEDDVGIELMNAKFREMGVLVADEDGYQVAPEFVDRVENAVREDLPDVEIGSPEHREAVLAELHNMGIPSGFEQIVANWVVHALRSADWE